MRPPPRLQAVPSTIGPAWALLVALAFTGCVQDPLASQPDGLPVVRVTNEFAVYDANGTAWHPSSSPGFDCPPPFRLVDEQRVIEYDPNLDVPVGEAGAVVQLPARDPTAYHATPTLVMLTPARPETSMQVGRPVQFNVTVAYSDQGVSFNGAMLAPESSQTQRLDYSWKQSDGSILNVTERLHVQHLGLWPTPWNEVEAPVC